LRKINDVLEFVSMRMRGRAWTDDDLKRLAAIVAADGTSFRAAAALKRVSGACRSQARKIGTPFTQTQITHKNIKAKCAAAEKALAR
jgi:hypothetical protein